MHQSRPDNTALVGFSQGAIMALEATQSEEPPAQCVIALAGRFAQPVRRAPPDVRYHLIHGADDAVIRPAFSLEAAPALQKLGAEVTVDVLPGLGHGIDMRGAELVDAYLRMARCASATHETLL